MIAGWRSNRLPTTPIPLAAAKSGSAQQTTQPRPRSAGSAPFRLLARLAVVVSWGTVGGMQARPMIVVRSVG